MLERIEWIILFLGADAGAYSSDQVRIMKGLFLLSQIPAQPLGRHYQFEAHESGPFVPKVYRDLDELQLAGLISVQRQLGMTRRTYELTDLGRQRFSELKRQVSPAQLQEVEDIKRRVTSVSIHDLLEQIAEEYPDYVLERVARLAN